MARSMLGLLAQVERKRQHARAGRSSVSTVSLRFPTRVADTATS